MIEQEYKYMISCEGFNILLKKYKSINPILISNSYYSDTNGILNSKHITVRFREINHKCIWEIKYPVLNQCKLDSALSLRQEYSIEASKKLSPEDLFNITGVKIDSLICIGKLVTLRHEIKIDSYNFLCLDKNEYLGITDYECELEFTGSSANIVLLNQLKAFAIYGITGGKRTRFLRRLREIKNESIRKMFS